MKLHFEEEDLTERHECSALTSNLEGTALNCVLAKNQYQQDTACIAKKQYQRTSCVSMPNLQTTYKQGMKR